MNDLRMRGFSFWSNIEVLIFEQLAHSTPRLSSEVPFMDALDLDDQGLAGPLRIQVNPAFLWLNPLTAYIFSK